MNKAGRLAAERRRKITEELERRAESRGNILMYLHDKGFIEISKSFEKASKVERHMEACRVWFEAKSCKANPRPPSWDEQVGQAVRISASLMGFLSGFITGLHKATPRKRFG